MRLDLIFLLIIFIYHQAFARPEIAPENPFFIHPSSSAELREISNRASPEDFIVALDNSAAAVSNRFPEINNPSQPTVPSGQYETDLSAAGSTDRISLTGSNNDCASPSSRKFRKRQTCAGNSKEDSADGEDPDSAHSQTESESGCSPSSGSKLRKRQYCRWSSGSDEPQDDSSPDYKKRLCPRNRKTLCCKGPKPSGIYTQGCSDCKWLIPPSLPRHFPSPIPSSVIGISNTGWKIEKKKRNISESSRKNTLHTISYHHFWSPLQPLEHKLLCVLHLQCKPWQRHPHPPEWRRRRGILLHAFILSDSISFTCARANKAKRLSNAPYIVPGWPAYYIYTYIWNDRENKFLATNRKFGRGGLSSVHTTTSRGVIGGSFWCSTVLYMKKIFFFSFLDDFVCPILFKGKGKDMDPNKKRPT